MIHAPDPQGDPRNIHAHVLVSLRKIGPEGFARTKAEQQERYRNRGAFVDELREKWETLANRHLARNGIDARIDRRSLEDGVTTRFVRNRTLSRETRLITPLSSKVSDADCL